MIIRMLGQKCHELKANCHVLTNISPALSTSVANYVNYACISYVLLNIKTHEK